MENLWSENIQGVLTLYLSRKLRFHDFFMEQYKDLFRLEVGKKLRILEIGCGPGALAGALHRWFPDAEIFGIDRDSNFIEFARQHEPGAKFFEGDAAALPFEDDFFDVTISYTVSEHIEPGFFYAEQKRVLKKGGVCLVLSVRKPINCIADCLAETEAEREFWQSIPDDDVCQKAGVGKYWQTEQQLPAVMEKFGFADVSTGFAAIALTPDDPKLPAGFSEEIINAERQGAIEAVLHAHSEKADEMIDIINKKYDQRSELLRSGKKQWDTYTTVTMAVRGTKN